MVEMTVVAVEDTDLLSFHAGKGLYMKHLVVTDDVNEVSIDTAIAMLTALKCDEKLISTPRVPPVPPQALVQWYSPRSWNDYQPWNMFGDESEIVSVRLDVPMLADKTYTVAISFVSGYDAQDGEGGGLFVDILPDGVA